MTRIAVIEEDKCHPDKCGNYLCMRLCPVNRTGEECIIKGENKKAFIIEEKCAGCGICPKRCPFGAIHILNLPEALDKEPIHRYGANGFALFNLPTPVFGKVVGVIGRNGIGKSTAMKILAGIIKPNLGKEKHEATYDELIEYFKGTEAHLFFEKVKRGEIRLSYKPQQVDQIPKQFKGTVKELLKKVDEKKEFDKIVGLLDLQEILDTDISNISGGELQRVAIAATVLKKANIYFFDEPTSYLDIKQRLKVSQFIRSLVNADTGVMVIEHDLIILDYLSDFVHLMYGEEVVFGVVSHLKATKAGINTYLSGYLKDENVRFRPYEIRFEKRPPVHAHREQVVAAWVAIDETVGRFHLSAKEGNIEQHDIIGILGENGIGKTTFVKILAGEIKSKGNLKDLKISCKPQYLESSDEPVITYLKDAAKYEVVFRPLHLKGLQDKKLSELSGGELQRVAIARCLSADADLFLLDEPSAYLDIEQRLTISKVLRELMILKGKSCLVVDHDLLFIDYISKKLLVFQGRPALNGEATGVFSMEEGMNHFLKDINLTFRRDEETLRPRANKPESQMDRKQKAENKLYYG
ncbi:MAG: ribosome biogenesis/translation initiation ATPase RLI [Nanoarchaeota archaeon]